MKFYICYNCKLIDAQEPCNCCRQLWAAQKGLITYDYD